MKMFWLELQTKVKRRFAKISQSQRRPILRPSPGWKRLLAHSHSRIYEDSVLHRSSTRSPPAAPRTRASCPPAWCAWARRAAGSACARSRTGRRWSALALRSAVEFHLSSLSEYQLCIQHSFDVNQQDFQSEASRYNYLQVSGLSSWGYGCGEPLMPDIFTSLAYYRDWILDNITSWNTL